MRLQTRIRLAIALLFAAFLAMPRAAHAVGETTGRLIGRVTEAQTGASVPGATITVSNPGLGAPIQTTTSEDGSFDVVNLPYGAYDVEISYAGVKPIRRRVAINANQATPLNVAWSAELAQAETTVVVEERHPTRPDTAMTGSTWDIGRENKLPIARTYQTVVGQTPGTLFTGNPNVKGAHSRQNKVLIDGLDTNDPVTHTFSANLNFDATAAVQVITGGMEAKYNAAGGIINVITNSGSDEFHGDASFFVRAKQFQSAVNTGSQVFNGIKQFSDAEPPPLQRYEAAVNLNGPIIKHHLWFAAGLQYIYDSQAQPPGPPLNVQAPNRLFVAYYPRLKFTFAPNSSHRFVLHAFGDPTPIDFENNNTSVANRDTPQASVGRFQGGYKLLGQWDYFITRNLDTHVLAGYQYQVLDIGPMGKRRTLDAKYGPYDFDRPSHRNLDFLSAAYYNPYQGTDQLNRRHKVSLDASIAARFRALGFHEAEVGFQGSYNLANNPRTYTGKGVVYNDQGGGPGEAGLCDADPYVARDRGIDPANPTGNGCNQRFNFIPSVALRQEGFFFGIYAQDRWKPVRWLTLVPGLRWDFARGSNSLNQSFMVYGFGPRFAALADLTGDSKTIFQVSYSRVNDSEYLSPVSIAEQTRRITADVYVWNQSQKQFVFAQTIGGGDARVDSKTRTPQHTDEIIVALRREIFRNSVAGVEYTFKYIQNLWDTVEVNNIWDPSGTRIVNFANPATQGSVLVTTNPDNNWIKYQDVEFFVEGRPTANWDLAASYVLSWRYGPGVNVLGGPLGSPSNQFENPRLAQFFDGWAADDTRHNLRINPAYTWRGITLGALFQWTSGQPLRHFFLGNTAASGGNRVRAPFGQDPGNPDSTTPGVRINDVNSWSEFRLPDLITLSLALRYDFYELIHQHLIASVDLLNVLNLRTATDLATSETGYPRTFGQVTARQAPFQLQLGLRYAF